MIVSTATNRFIVSPLHTQFYQELINSSVGFHELGAKLVRHAEHCYIFRSVNQAEEAARLLINIPLRQYHLIGQYYLGWCEYVRGVDVKCIFERVAEDAPLQYRARAMHTLAALAARESDSISESHLIVESMKVSPSLEGLRGMAILKAKEGFHSSSMKDLEACLPFARYADPLSYYDFLNSYAVELGEVGRLDEAENVSRLTIASPFAPYYLEWQSTFSEIRTKRKSRSTVAVSLPEYDKPFDNVVQFPIPQASSDSENVLDMSQGIDLAPLELLSLILKVVLKDTITDEQIEKICTVYFETVMKLWGE